MSEVKQKENQTDKQIFVKTLKYFLTKLALLGIIGYIIFTFVIGITQINGMNMYPNLKDGDLVIYNRLEKEFSKNDAVIYEYDGKLKYGRILGGPGDEINLTQDGRLMINGNIQNENVMYLTEAIEGGITYPFKIKEDSYFILSDNRPQGGDSRKFGDVSKESIKGSIFSILRVRNF